VFKASGGAAPYTGRPNITPFLVPLYHEEQSLKDTQLWIKLREQDSSGKEFDKPLPAYVWQYRPEYQFTQYQLIMQAINKVQKLDTPEQTIKNLIKLDKPIIANGADIIEAYYSLNSQYERLTPIDGPQDLVLSMGDNERRVTLGVDQSISFDDLDNLNSLEAEDFLTLRLYANNDVGKKLIGDMHKIDIHYRLI